MCAAVEAPGFKVTKKYAVPGNGGFDYIVFDKSSNRLYVSHGTEVDVLDADSGIVLGKVEDTPGVHGIAIVPELHRGFTTNGGNATVSIFDTNTFKTIKKISVPKDPDFTLYDSRTKQVLGCHGDAAAITAIDPEKEVVSGQIEPGGGAEGRRSRCKRNRVREPGGIRYGRQLRSPAVKREREMADHGLQDANRVGDGYAEFPLVHRLPKQSAGRYGC
jgi:hypothetical protein